VTTHGQTDRHTHRQTDANRFYYLSHAICYSYGTDKKKNSSMMANKSHSACSCGLLSAMTQTCNLGHCIGSTIDHRNANNVRSNIAQPQSTFHSAANNHLMSSIQYLWLPQFSLKHFKLTLLLLNYFD